MLFKPPAAVLTAIAQINAAGFACHLVGGCVRDFLLGRAPHDFDLTTNALPAQIKAIFADRHCIDTGIAHGTVTVLIDTLPLEITTYRVDGGYTDARHPDFVRFTDSLTEDLARRDFTVNAIAYHPESGLFDPFGGQAAITEKMLRCVGEPKKRFTEDALRILRCIRFAAQLDFSIAPQTALAVHTYRERLSAVSVERIQVELDKLLCGIGAQDILLAYPDVLCVPIPEIAPSIGFTQHSRFHCYDVWTHTAHAVGAIAPERILRLTMLLHDIGKPACFTQDADGTGHFKRHAAVGAEQTETILRRLHYDNRTIEAVTLLVQIHADRLKTEPQMRRLLSQLGEIRFFELLAVQRADIRAKMPQYLSELPLIDEFEHKARMLLGSNACLQLRNLAVGGNDLIALGFTGKEIGQALTTLLDRVLIGELPNERATLLAAAQQLHP